MRLTDIDLADLVAWRRKLHAMPETSDHEAETAREVTQALSGLAPDRIVGGIGGHGVAAVFNGTAPGPTVLFRADLDALAIEETAEIPHRSRRPGCGHLCGHDGHMATVMALGRTIARRRPARGRVVLMFQPAEETGAGAARVVADPAYDAIRPDYAFAYHNFPGLPVGTAAVVAGPVTCASRGMKIILTGRTAHASMPETGLSPIPAILQLLPALSGLTSGTPPAPDFMMVTITHVDIGKPTFGIAPARAEVWATLRTLVDTRMDGLRRSAEGLARRIADEAGLNLDIAYAEDFSHCENDPDATAILRRALDAEGIVYGPGDLPLRGSEDFGKFGWNGTKAALFLLGAGENRPQLHNSDYDFNDDLIGIGARIFARVARDLLG